MDSKRVQRNHEVYYYAKYYHSDESNTKQTYTIWMKKNFNNRQYVDSNKLVNIRRQILRDKILTDTEISQIEEATKNLVPERNV